MAVCIFFNGNCWKDLSLAASNNLWTSGNCESCLTAHELGGFNPSTIKVLGGNAILLSGARIQYVGMV